MAEQRLDRAQVTKAVEALLKYVRAQAGEKKALLGESDVVSLVVALQKVPETGRNKPFPMQVSVAPPRPRAMRAALAASQRAGRSVRALVASCCLPRIRFPAATIPFVYWLLTPPRACPSLQPHPTRADSHG